MKKTTILISVLCLIVCSIMAVVLFNKNENLLYCDEIVLTNRSQTVSVGTTVYFDKNCYTILPQKCSFSPILSCNQTGLEIVNNTVKPVNAGSYNISVKVQSSQIEYVSDCFVLTAVNSPTPTINFLEESITIQIGQNLSLDDILEIENVQQNDLNVSYITNNIVTVDLDKGLIIPTAIGSTVIILSKNKVSDSINVNVVSSKALEQPEQPEEPEQAGQPTENEQPTYYIDVQKTYSMNLTDGSLMINFQIKSNLEEENINQGVQTSIKSGNNVQTTLLGTGQIFVSVSQTGTIVIQLTSTNYDNTSAEITISVC